MSTLTLQHLQTHHIGPIDLTVAAAECVVISGPSGAGKSLLLRAIADLDPHEGEVLLDGVAQSRTSPPQWRSQVGLLPADSPWWFDTVGAHFDGVDAEALQQLGFDPEVMGWQVARLSSGEKQRLALLRLLSRRPRALLLDEASANLDGGNTARVEAVVARYRRAHEAPVVWVSHDAGQIGRVADRHFVLREGQLVAGDNS